MEWLFERETDKNWGKTFADRHEMGWCGRSSSTSRFLAHSLPSDCFPQLSFSKGHLTRGTAHSHSLRQALDSLDFTELISSSEAENTNSSFSPRKGLVGNVRMWPVKRCPAGWLIPLCSQGFDSKIFSNLADFVIHTLFKGFCVNYSEP